MSRFTDHDDLDAFTCECNESRRFIQRYGAHVRTLRCTDTFVVTRRSWLPALHGDVQPDGLYCGRCERRLDITLAEGFWGSLGDVPMAIHDPTQSSAQLEQALTKALSDLGAHCERHVRPAREARHAPTPAKVIPALADQLTHPLYTHQAAAIAAALDGGDVLQTTATSSGKSLGLLLPTLQRLLTDGEATAVALYPTKALVRDQVKGLRMLAIDATDLAADGSVFELSFGEGLPKVVVGQLNSDVEQAVRAKVYSSARLLITTPDQLHCNVLPRSASEPRFLEHLSVLVIDEVHSYTDQLGSNLAALLRRLDVTVPRRSGRRPQLLMASASIAAPTEWFRALTGRSDVTVVDDDGSASAEFVLLTANVSAMNFAGSGRSIEAVLSGLALELCDAFAGSPPSGIVFHDSKAGSERIGAAIAEKLRDAGHLPMALAVGAYHGGVGADRRAASESDIRRGAQRLTIATSALELGVDLPTISYVVISDASISQAELKQRLGRAGRRGPGVAVVLIGAEGVGSWPVTSERVVDDAFGTMRPVPLPTPTKQSQLHIGIEGLVHDLGALPADARSNFDQSLIEALVANPDWTIDDNGSLRPNAKSKLESLRPPSLQYEVVDAGTGRSILKWNVFDSVKEGWVGNIISDHLGHRYEVTRIIKGARRIEVRRSKSDDITRSRLVISYSNAQTVSSEQRGAAKISRLEGEVVVSMMSPTIQRGDEIVSRSHALRVGCERTAPTAITVIEVPAVRGAATLEDLGVLLGSCLDVLGIGRYEVEFRMNGSKLVFCNPRGAAATAAWAIVDRFDELVAAAIERLERHGRLRTLRGWVSAEQFRPLLARFAAAAHDLAA